MGRSIAEGEKCACGVALVAILALPVGVGVEVTLRRSRSVAPVHKMAFATTSARFVAHLVAGCGEADLATASAWTGLPPSGAWEVGVVAGFERDELTVVVCTSEGSAAEQKLRRSAASSQN
jgi:hypothetical protein